MNEVQTIQKILADARRIAVVGASDRADRASRTILRYLVDQDLDVVPVNPMLARIDDLQCHRALSTVSPAADTVICFRRSEHMPELARQAVAAGARALWMQEGVISEEAAKIARDAGLLVVMDRCYMVEHRRYRCDT